VNRQDIITKHVGAYNGGLHKIGDEYLCVYRSSEFQPTSVWLDKDLQVIADSYSYFAWDNVDPRLVEFDGGLWMQTSYMYPQGHDRIELWKLEFDGRKVKTGERCVFGHIEDAPGYRHSCEKNWQPFVYNNKLHFIRWIHAHHQVLLYEGHDGDRGKVRQIHKTEWKSPIRIPGTVSMRGSVTPKLLPGGEHYLSIWHTKEHGADYWSGFYTFASSPPFEVTAVGSALWRPDDLPYCNKRDAGIWRRSYFPISMNIIDDQVQVCGGVNDYSLTVFTLPLQEVLDGLHKVSSRADNKQYLPTLAELIDRLSIVQLKENFIGDHKQEYAEEIKKIVHDIQIELDGKPLTGDVVRAIVVLAQMNLHIWHNEHQVRNGLPGAKLELTHGLNGIRNVAKNKIQEVVGGRKDYKIDCLAAEFKDWEVSW
jgi:hypothetical protein